LFASGGYLDSQTSDTQLFDGPIEILDDEVEAEVNADENQPSA
jgi:hypothetical protein